jgi:fumarate reductase subunit D
MLWIADALTWAIGAGGEWRAIVEPVLEAVIETEA